MPPYGRKARRFPPKKNNNQDNSGMSWQNAKDNLKKLGEAVAPVASGIKNTMVFPPYGIVKTIKEKYDSMKGGNVPKNPSPKKRGFNGILRKTTEGAIQSLPYDKSLQFRERPLKKLK